MTLLGQFNNILCVPMKVQAMRVGKSPVPTVFANIADDFSRIELDALGNYVPSDLMSETSEEKPGIHLHWTLPEGLRQGFQPSESDEPEYPSVPNRWIITRLMTAEAQSELIQCKHWIVESDALEKISSPELGNEGSLTFPKLDDPKWPYRILGRSYPYEVSMTEPEERLKPLHALAPGNPAFSAMYPYHRNVFGFYDDLLDERGTRYKNKQISYVVRGFYDDELPMLQSAEMCLEQYGWKPPKGLSYPATLALHGVVTEIHWCNDEKNYNEFIHMLDTPKLAVGNTSAEALSALHGAKDYTTERLMRGLLNDQSNKWLQLSGIYQADYAEHDQRFQMVAEQNTYTLQSKISDHESAVLPQLTLEEQKIFRQLQQGMTDLYQKMFAASSKQGVIYDLWCKYMVKAQVTNPMERDEAKKLMERYRLELEHEMEELHQANGEIAELKEQLRLLEQQLASSIDVDYELSQTAGSRYYEPNSLVLLLSGAKRGALFDTKLHKTESLDCRLLQETVQALQFDFSLRGQSFSAVIRSSQLLQESEVKGSYPELLLEGVLFCSSSAELIATLIGQQLGLLPFSAEEGKELAAVVRQIQRSMNSGLVESGERFPDPLFLNLWEQAWNPVLLCWRGLYYPDQTLIGSQPELSNWTFTGTDYAYSGPSIDTSNAVVMEGKIILTPHVAEQLQAMTVKQLGAELAQSIGSLNQLDYLSQTLDGFNDRFLMRQQALRFPVMVFDKGSPQLAEQVRQSLSSLTIEKPLFNTFFSPLRGGFFKFDQLRLIDVFGQFQDIRVQEYAIAEDMRMPQQPPIGQTIMLPPRFIQPTRLEFSWLQSRGVEPCDFNLADSPICGWMIPNRTDQSLLIYDENGVMLGSLNATAYDDDRVQWRNAPGMPHTNSTQLFNSDHNELPLAMNPDMKAFLNEMLRRSREEQEDVLTPFLQIVDSALWDIHSQESPGSSGLSLFVGKPLILAKANIKLVQAGPPDRYKALDSHSKKPAPIPDISLKRFEMPLWIGEKHHLHDGVVGFFNQDESFQYKQFNSAFVEPDSASDYLIRNNQINVSADEQATGTTVSMILDPLESIHLISGMLPVSKQRIPQQRIEAALERLFITLYVGPLLAGEESYVMPLTKLPNRTWQFITPGEAEEWIETETLRPSNGNAFLAKPPFRAVEGWLKLKLGEDADD